MAQVVRFLRRWRSDEGAQLVEYALVLPMLLLLVLGICEFGFIFQRYEVITNASREGARMAVLPNYATADVQSRVGLFLTNGRVPTTSTNPAILVESTTVPVSGGRPAMNTRRVTVTYTYTFQFLKPIAALFGATYTTVPLVGVSEMRVEGGS